MTQNLRHLRQRKKNPVNRAKLAHKLDVGTVYISSNNRNGPMPSAIFSSVSRMKRVSGNRVLIPAIASDAATRLPNPISLIKRIRFGGMSRE